MPWELTGNAGTNANIDFVGTTDKRPLVIRTVRIERARILTNGYLGLGTKTPGARLTVANGGAFINGVSVGVDAPGIDYAYEYETVGVNDPRWNLRLQSPGSIFFHTGGSPPTQNVVVTAAGRVGVGTATPGARVTAEDVGPSRGGALDQAAIIGRVSNPAPVGTGGETAGVRGVNDEGHGVQGQSVSSAGVEGTSRTGTGVLAECQSGIGLFARTISGVYAGFFAGNVYISGSVSKPGGGFAIDHPVDPENRYLNHSFVESPERKNIYDGIAVLDEEGRAEVALPEWFAALNRDLRYQLTAIGAPAPSLHVARELADGRFGIAGGAAGQTVSWQVSGIRDDVWARANPIEVEEPKAGDERGRYLHPELYGHTEEQGVHWPWLPRRRAQSAVD
jgi:hypothetical protein